MGSPMQIPAVDLDDEDLTPVQTERVLVRCVPCLGTGEIRTYEGKGRELVRRCTWCRGCGLVKIPPARRPRS